MYEGTHLPDDQWDELRSPHGAWLVWGKTTAEIKNGYVTVPSRGMACMPTASASNTRTPLQSPHGAWLVWRKIHSHRARVSVTVPSRGMVCMSCMLRIAPVLQVTVPLRGMVCTLMGDNNLTENVCYSPLTGHGLYVGNFTTTCPSDRVTVPSRGMVCMGKNPQSTSRNGRKNTPNTLLLYARFTDL